MIPRNKKLLQVAPFVFFLLIISCKKNGPDNHEPDPILDPTVMRDMKVPAGFNYEGFMNWKGSFRIQNNADQPIKNAVISVYTADPQQGGHLLYKGATDNSGSLKCNIRMATAQKTLWVLTSVPGIPEGILVNSWYTAEIVLGGSHPQWIKTETGDKVYSGSTHNKAAVAFSNRHLPLGWSANGVPLNLVSPSDVIPTSLLNDLNAALPSMVSVPVNHPSWLDDAQYKRTLLLTQAADVWVTFVSEGAGYRNTLFYYKYHKNHPPQSVNDIDSLYLIFPNASLLSSGGALVAGNKVSLGRIGADTVIAYGIAANGYNINNGTISNGMGLLFANKDFNPESNPALRQHLVILRDVASSKYIMGFEDLNRSSSGCDHDFNDVMFYTTSNPATAISADSIAGLPATQDDDGDGVSNTNDEFPNDPQRAFKLYYPAAGTYASVAYEDLWPWYGDYDFNDVVVDFNYMLVTNAANQVKDVEGNYVLRASGGQIRNAFAVQFPCTPAQVSAISGASAEAQQTQLVATIWPDIRAVQNAWNTVPGETRADSVYKQIRFTLGTAIPLSQFGQTEYNPFIYGVSDGKNRGMEIHLPGKQPTDLADASQFSTGDDRTGTPAGKWYLSHENLPWAILTPQRFEYPIEKADIVSAYLKFGQWAQSGGSTYTNWYENASGYRNAQKIYK